MTLVYKIDASFPQLVAAVTLVEGPYWAVASALAAWWAPVHGYTLVLAQHEAVRGQCIGLAYYKYVSICHELLALKTSCEHSP